MTKANFPLSAMFALLFMQGSACAFPEFSEDQAGTSLSLLDYELAWEDEFDSLNASRDGRGTGPWFSGVHTILVKGEEMAHIGDEAYAIDNGVLVMSTRVNPKTRRRVEAHLQTADKHGHIVAFQNAYFEAKLALPEAKGSHSGFWLLSEEKGKGHTEVDVVEAYGPGDEAIHSSSHIWPRPPREHESVSNYQREKDLFGRFHTYGLMATDDEFKFYFDGKEIAKIERLAEQRVALYMLLSVFGNPTQPVIEQPAIMQVDYVRVYTPKNKSVD